MSAGENPRASFKKSRLKRPQIARVHPRIDSPWEFIASNSFLPRTLTRHPLLTMGASAAFARVTQ